MPPKKTQSSRRDQLHLAIERHRNGRREEEVAWVGNLWSWRTSEGRPIPHRHRLIIILKKCFHIVELLTLTIYILMLNPQFHLILFLKEIDQHVLKLP